MWGSFDNSYVRDLSGLYVRWSPQPAPQPRWLRFNHALAQELGLDDPRLADAPGLAVFAGQALPEGAEPVAQAYAGHQFGGFSAQLGDGRALLLGERLDRQGRRHDLAFKGSGPTPFSRGGDGKAAVGPVLREYLISEAMHALGIPTTRVLAAVRTGETVRRERPLPGALLTRTASSHIRVGTFEFAAARHDTDGLQRLLRHTLARHDPDLLEADQPALALLRRVGDRQARLVAQWMGVGFVHGVMNTDNMTVSGETIDYGPCAFMEVHDPDTVFSSIDRHGRYAYGQQPGIAQWNLARLAKALLPLIPAPTEQAVEAATEAVQAFSGAYQRAWLEVFRPKLGLLPLAADEATDATDQALAQDALSLLATHGLDHTLGFRRLSGLLEPATAAPELSTPDWQAWRMRWQARLAWQHESPRAIAARMAAANPCVVPRNHRVEEALAAATDHHDLQPFEALLAAIQRPWDDTLADSPWAQPAPPAFAATYRTFCGT
jgi:serine/tyrosine/threonine adenylyltransferase